MPNRMYPGMAGQWRVLVSASAVLFTAVACSSATTGGSAAGGKSTLTIGVINDATGSQAPTVVPQVNGMVAWAKVIDALGGLDGHQVKMDVCDGQSTTTGTLACGQKLTGDGIVISEGTTGEVDAVAPQLLRSGKVVLTPDPTLNPPAGSNLFQTVPALSAGVKTFLTTAKINKITSLGLVTTDDASGIAITKAVDGAAGHLGLAVTSQLIADDATDATVQVQKLLSARVGMIYDGVVGAEGVLVLKAAKALGVKVPIVVNAGDVYPSFLAAAAGSIPGQIYGAPPANLAVPGLLQGSEATALQTFEKQYKKALGKPMNLATTNFIGVVQGSNAANILLALGPNPSLSATESYLRKHKVGGVLPLQFPAAGLQVVSQTVGLAEAHADSRLWGACATSAVLTCP